MKSTTCSIIHRRKQNGQPKPIRRSREDRLLQASRFKVLCADAGLTLEATAKALHVTPRTVRNWFSGKTAVPYSAYRLVRIIGRFELPHPAWTGWVFHSGKLWTPEGHGFVPADSNCWSMLVRRARLFHQLVERQHLLDALLMRAGRAEPVPGGAVRSTARPGPVQAEPTGEAGRAAQPPGPNLLRGHISTVETTRSADERPLTKGARR